MIRRSVTKTMSIDRDPKTVFWFLADAANWPRWAVVNVKSARPAGRDWWDIETPAGRARLRIRADEAFGLLDHDFHSPEAQWTVPARVVANGDGSEFMITFFQPPAFSDEDFDQQVALVDQELATLKKLMEQLA
jgi:hypothetical protein